jgi:hypothetical protein
MDRPEVFAMRTANKGEPDWSLDRLVALIEHGGGTFPLTLLVGGTFIKGALVNSTEWADHLDESMDRVLGDIAGVLAAEQPPIESVEELAERRTSGAGDVEQNRAAWPTKGWRKFLDDSRADRADAEERLHAATGGEPAAFDSLPDDLAELAVALNLPKVALTLRDVTLLSIGPTGTPVGVTLPYVRVLAASVDAWWPGSFDFGSADEPVDPTAEE